MRNNFTQGALLDDRYTTICPLNHGSFGLVFKAQDVHTGEYVALKCLPKPDLVTGNLSVLVDLHSEELDIHRHIGAHPNIVNLVHHFETENHIYLVLAYCPNGDLYEAIRAGSSPKETERVREALLQLIDAVAYMHARGVYHRDIKPENIFLSHDRALKLGDFGLATRDVISNEAAVGSDRYMAPEQMDPPPSGYQSAKADVWAIGICLLNTLFSRNPFASPTVSDPLFADFAADRQTLFDIFPNMSQDTFDILVHCLAIDPDNRSLTAARAAVKKAVCFTTDNETMDDVETATSPIVTTVNREPLRTPSITSPQLDLTGAFPWAKSLALSYPVRQLSAIADEDLSDDFFGMRPTWDAPAAHDSSSLASFVDSGLGVSVKSSHLGDDLKRSMPMPISGSMPITMARSVPNPGFGRKVEVQSKSWSEIFKDDDEASEIDFSLDADQDSTFFNSVEDLTTGADSTGSGTPRAALNEMTATPNSRVATPVKQSKYEDHALFELEEHHEAPSSKSSSTPTLSSLFSPYKKRGLDKWAQLGDKRRQFTTPVKAQPTKEMVVPNTSSPAAINWRKRAQAESSQQPTKYKPASTWSLWGKDEEQTWTLPKPEIMNKEWNVSQDWRKRLIQTTMADDRLVF
jgi:serine/threonine protein kinase